MCEDVGTVNIGRNSAVVLRMGMWRGQDGAWQITPLESRVCICISWMKVEIRCGRVVPRRTGRTDYGRDLLTDPRLLGHRCNKMTIGVRALHVSWHGTGGRTG